MIAEEAVESARKLFALIAADRERVLAHAGSSVFSMRLFERLPRQPIVTIASVMKLLDTTKPTAGRAVDALVDAGVLVEATGRKRVVPGPTSAISTGYVRAPNWTGGRASTASRRSTLQPP